MRQERETHMITKLYKAYDNNDGILTLFAENEEKALSLAQSYWDMFNDLVVDKVIISKVELVIPEQYLSITDRKFSEEGLD